ncbi:MAG: hypothetical protein R2767_00735 [Chitinophagales bacterium]|nr:hypothetical protein [Chitinophagales bacterium]HAE12985.1 hypothetical protein [Bacteroidota bacterium]MCB9019907.1 hypothetical protein [Chitinophagales bacterium]HAE34856.1 hypothetical protein [Bacteroidota bacterium]HQU40020.1 hypothetical protein [Chitinophagales bacterium]
MKNLIEISKIVTKKRISKIEIFDKSLLNKKDSKFNEFYEGLVNNQFRNDDEAAQFLYDTTPLDDKYRQLKSRFTKRLMNTLFFLDANDPSFSNYHSAYYTCNKNWALIRILLSSGARNAATKLANKTLHVAQGFRFSDIILNCSRILMSNSSLTGRLREYDEFSLIANKAMKDLQAEMESEEYYQRLTIGLATSASIDEERAQLAEDYLVKVSRLCDESDSYILHFNMHQIRILALQFRGNYTGTIKACEEAEQFLEENPPFRQEVKLAALALIRINCYLQLRDYENGRKNAEKCLELFSEGTNNWFVFLEQYFLLAMHTENYINAAGIYLKVINHPRFPFTASERQEKWKIFEAYINYIFETENLDLDLLTDEGKRKFRILKFLNEVPHFSKDKKGFNVAILVIQILYMLEKGDYTGIINRSEALNVYCSRYLRKDDSYRSSCFLKMLLTMEKEDFKYDRTKQMAMKYLKKMTEDETGDNTVNEWEIIPYETLWEKVLNRLQNKVAAA